MSGGVVKKSGKMAASQSDGAAAVEFVEKRSFESTESHNDDAAEVRTLVSQPQPQPLSRLQKQAPAKMQVTRLSLESMGLCCRSPIPFLSPILVSPLGGRDLEKLLLTEEAGKQNPEEEEKGVVNSVIQQMDGNTPPRHLLARGFDPSPIALWNYVFKTAVVRDLLVYGGAYATPSFFRNPLQ